MLLLLLLETILMGSLVLFVVTQILLPILGERPLFPFFKSKESKIQAELLNTEQELYEQQLLRHIAIRKALIDPEVEPEVEPEVKSEVKSTSEKEVK
jgi:hypothetical protein